MNGRKPGQPAGLFTYNHDQVRTGKFAVSDVLRVTQENILDSPYCAWCLVMVTAKGLLVINQFQFSHVPGYKGGVGEEAQINAS